MSWLLRLWELFAFVRTMIGKVTTLLRVTGIYAASMAGTMIGWKKKDDEK